MKKDVFILLTMDCETARRDITPHAFKMSASGPWDYGESEHSIRGYAAVARAHRLSLTLFVHPEVAMANRELLLELRGQGCLPGAAPESLQVWRRSV